MQESRRVEAGPRSQPIVLRLLKAERLKRRTNRSVRVLVPRPAVSAALPFADDPQLHGAPGAYQNAAADGRRSHRPQHFEQTQVSDFKPPRSQVFAFLLEAEEEESGSSSSSAA